jgi:hypothetical protein
MKKKSIFICFLAIGAFVANAQDETKTQSTTKTQNETKSSGSVNDQSPSNSPNINNSGNTSTSEGTMSNSSTRSLHNGTKLEISDLPKAVSENISDQHKGWTPQEVYKIDNQGATAYKVIVKKNGDEMNLVYDARGNLLRTEPSSSTGSPGITSPTETK